MLGIALLLAACFPAAQGPSPEEIAAQVATSVAQTVEAQGQIASSVAMTVAAQETANAPVASPTLATTQTQPTLTPILPTATPFVIQPSGGGGGGGGGGGTNPGADYSCDVIAKPFPDWSEFNRNGEFDIKWTIVNNGTKTWVAGKDLTYFSGPNLTKSGATLVSLPEVKPGETFTIIFDGVAPADRGKHVMTWKLEGGFCYPYTAIVVK